TSWSARSSRASPCCSARGPRPVWCSRRPTTAQTWTPDTRAATDSAAPDGRASGRDRPLKIASSLPASRSYYVGDSTPLRPGDEMTHPHIGLMGYARSGKDTAGAMLHADLGYRRVSFADPVREMALALDPIIGHVDM